MRYRHPLQLLSNHVMHVIDQLFDPIPGLLESLPQDRFSKFIEGITTSGVPAKIEEAGRPVTILAPTDAAFEAAGINDLNTHFANQDAYNQFFGSGSNAANFNKTSPNTSLKFPFIPSSGSPHYFLNSFLKLRPHAVSRGSSTTQIKFRARVFACWKQRADWRTYHSVYFGFCRQSIW